MKSNVIKKKGFTLIELIIVIAIIGILAAIAVPKFGNIQKDAKVKADVATAKTISDAVSVLVAQGKISETIGTITPTLAPVPITVAADADSTTPVTGTAATAQIGRYLQSIPKPSAYKSQNFQVAVIAGNATVYVNSVQVYPTLTTTYGD